MYGSVINKKVKNDKIDAFNIVINLIHSFYKVVNTLENITMKLRNS